MVGIMCDRDPRPAGRSVGPLAGSLVLLLLLALLALLGSPGLSRAEEEENSSIGGDPGAKEFPDGATLKIEPDLAMKLARAEVLLKEGRVDLAVSVWQFVLDKISQTPQDRQQQQAGPLQPGEAIDEALPSAVMTRPEWAEATFSRKYRRYKSMAAAIEPSVAQLSAEGLRIYRLTADAEAKEILAAAGAGEREAALAEVVRRFFFSALGDDAAYELACRQLDRFEFVGASRLLAKIVEDYPGPSIPREQILLRLAVASARLGDVKAAQAALEALRATPLDPDLVSLVAGEVQQAGTRRGEARPSRDWKMLLGGPERNATMYPPPVSATAQQLSERWEVREDLDEEPSSSDAVRRHARRLIRYSNQARVAAAMAPAGREQLIGRWKENRWTPAGGLLLDDGRVYFTAADHREAYQGCDSMVCVDAKTGKLIWRSRPYFYQLDPISQRIIQYKQAVNAGDRPQTLQEVQLFGDRVFPSAAIIEDTLYKLEGRLYEQGQSGDISQQGHAHHQSIPRRTRKIWLGAYNAANGKLRWRRGAHERESQANYEIGFLASPVPYKDLLIAPVSDNGALWIYALASAPSSPGAEDAGRTVWKTFLCDEPASGCSPWSPVGVAVEGGDLYVSTGAGVVVALDAPSGYLRWIVRYQRATELITTSNSSYRQRLPSEVDGWEQDVVIPYGKQLIVLASDYDHLLALDRRTGEHLWESPRVPVEEDPAATYCLGVAGRGLYLAGPRIVRKYDIGGGSLIWEKAVEASHGRGCLTSEAIYLPVKDSIMKIDLETGRDLAQVGVTTPSGEPVGNLYTDGDRFYAVGLGRVYALTELDYRLQRLSEQIAKENARSQLERMRLLDSMQRKDEAIADMRGAYELLLEQQGPLIAWQTLLDSATELELAAARPKFLLTLLADTREQSAAEQQPTTAGEASDLQQQRDALLFSALQTIHVKNLKGATREILGAAPLYGNDRLLETARRAMAVTVEKSDQDVIKQALAAQDARVRVIAAAGVAEALPDTASEHFTALLSDDDARVRLAAAKALADEGERKSLAVLVDLLESDDLMIRVRSAQALRALTGERFDFAAYDKPDRRAAAVAKWRGWVDSTGQTAELHFPLNENALLLGRTLMCYYGQNKVVELDAEGKAVHEETVKQPWGCQGLPNGHRVIASYQSRSIVEFDQNWKKVWEATGLAGRPFSVQKLPNGNFLVPFYSSNKLVEISWETKEVVWQRTVSGNPMDARRLPNGNTLVCLMRDSKVVEINRDGKSVWEVGGMYRPRSAQRLENGNTLISQTNGGRVVEVDPRGEEVWKYEGLSNPFDAQRLPNGNTLIVDSRGVKEVNREKKVIWQKPGGGVSRVSRY